MQPFVQDFFHALVTQEQTASHEQGGNQGRHESTDQQRQRHQDEFVDKRALEYRPDDRQFPVGLHARDLLGVERKVVAHHPRGFLDRHLAHHGHVVQDGGNVVKQGKQAGGHDE